MRIVIALGCGLGLLVLLQGSAWGAALLGAALLLLALGITRIDSGIFGAARTSVGAGIALTYDDGPDPDSTPPLLELLADRGAKATFFVVGRKVRAHPELVRRCKEEGHTIGNHSDRHATWTNFLFGARLRREIANCQRAVEEAIGEPPRFYRPPFGLMNPHVERATRRLGLEIVGWSIRSLDTVRADAAERVVARLHPGAIVLLHDGGLEPERVLHTTRTILDAAADRGLEANAL